ncbi:MAG TPA: hypothetical protein PLK64_14420 [Dermatophilaceae bacterium]|nr:hypothetical protein [Dermatophilaceae bacterium]
MGRQQDRVAARQAIHEARIARRREQREREAAVEQLAVQVQVELRAGARGLAEAEARAGALIEQMITVHGLTARDVATWCADGMTAREASRLRRVAVESTDEDPVA